MVEVTLTCSCGRELTPDGDGSNEWYDGTAQCDCGARYVCTVTEVVLSEPPEE